MRTNRKYAITFSQPSLTQQHSKDEVDINNIMARYIKTGTIDHVSKYQGQYLENSDLDYHQSQNIVKKADEMFAELPSTVRREFQNNPSEFLKFVSDEKNHSKLAEMGLAHKTEPDISPVTKKPPITEKPKETKTQAEKPAPAAP